MQALFALFTNPLLLPGVLLAGAPVVIHLLSRQRASEIPFPSLRFLRLTAERTARRRRLEEVILLLLRALALAVVSLALARPVISGQAGGWGGGAVSSVVLLDNTLSMHQEAAGRPALARAAEAARQVLAGLPAGSRWALWLPSGQPEDDPLRAVRARPDVAQKEALEGVSGTAAHGDLSTLVRQAAERLREETTAGRELVVLTDGQTAAWEKLDEAVAAVGRGSEIRTFVYAAEGAGKPNVAVESVHLQCRAPLKGEALTVEALLRGYGPRPFNVTMTLYMGGALAARQRVVVPAAGLTAVRFTVPLGQAGWLEGMVRIDADACVRDNAGFFALEVRDAIRVLLVDGNRSRLKRTRASHYLAAALAPLGAGPIRPRTIRPAALAREDLGRVDVLFLTDVGRLSEEAVARLKIYVRAGGVLVLIPGEAVRPAVWNRLLGAETDTLGGLLPTALGAAQDLSGAGGRGLALAPGEAGHPLLAPFAAVARQSLRRVRVARAFGLTVEARSPARVALRLETGEPFVATKAYGAGRTILWAAPCTPSWTTFQARPVFVPWVHAHAYCGLGVEESGSVRAGHPLLLAAPETVSETALTLQTPAGEEADLARDNVSRENPLRYAETWQEGFYRARFRQPQERRRVFAVSPAGEEGDLACIDPAVLKTHLGRLGPVACVESLAGLADAQEEAREGLRLEYPLLVVALLLLVAESVYGAGRARHAAA